MADHIEYAKTARALMAQLDVGIKNHLPTQPIPPGMTNPEKDIMRMQQGFLMEKALQYADASTKGLPEKERDKEMKDVHDILARPTYDPERCGPLKERLESDLGRTLDREAKAATQPKEKGLSQKNIQPPPAETSRTSKFMEGFRGREEARTDQNQPSPGKDQPGTAYSRFLQRDVPTDPAYKEITGTKDEQSSRGDQDKAGGAEESRASRFMQSFRGVQQATPEQDRRPPEDRPPPSPPDRDDR
ncbi:MAG: hypothetical protein KDD67_15785 [Ignavibacteriae bacterium]|nr:hypothetical protein [Ignavibacteriota bacterium]MCB9215717.1 hypothetical protein [Ignavibacteria bacterium]